MKQLFGPAITVMSRLRYGQKFGLLGALALLAIVILQFSLYHALDRVIEPSRQELLGLDAVLRLSRTIQLAQQHRAVSAGLLGGNPSFADKQRAKGAEVDAAMARLREALPAAVAAAPRWQEVSAGWQTLRADGLNWSQQQNTARHEQLIAQMMVVMTDIADASALTLDPDMASYYLMDTLVNLPFFTERLGQTRALGTAILARKHISEAEKLALAALLGNCDIARALQKINLDKVVAYNPALRARLESMDLAIDAAMRAALAVVREDLLTGRLATSADSYVAQFSALIDQNYRSGAEVLAPALQVHLQARIAAARQRLALTVLVSVLTCLLFAYLAVGTYLALSDQVNQARRAMRALVADSASRAELVEAIAAGDLGREVPLSAPLELGYWASRRDEIGALGAAIREMDAVQGALGRGFARMTHTLRRHRDDERDQDWFKSGINAVNVEMRGERGMASMAQDLLAYLTAHVGAAVGALYLFDARHARLQLLATHALAPGSAARAVFALGEGVGGEAARAQRTTLLNKVPPGYLPIGSGLGQADPAALVAVPLLHDGVLMGLLEVGSFGTITPLHVDWLEQAGEAIAIAIGVLQARARVNELLEQTQAQTEELRVQQEELQQSNEELEERAQLLEQQREVIRLKSVESEAASAELQRKAEQLERTSAYKSEFLANMSHELRTPLNSMLILSSLLQQNKEGLLTAKQVEYAATINGAGKDLLNLINDILDLSKIEAGRLDLHIDDVLLEPVAGQLHQLFDPLAEHQGLQFLIEIVPGTPAQLRADAQRTQQILKNLLSNAFKFTTAGQVTLSMRAAAPGEFAGAALAFAVSDSGIGIAPDKHEQIFHAFQQADGSTSRKFGGTGLGLSISRQLARQMGGEIVLTSAPGAGSVFTLYLPLQAPAGVPTPAAPPGLPSERPASALGLARAAPPSGAAPPASLAAPVGSAGRSAPLVGAAELPPMPVEDDRARLQSASRTILIIEDDLAFAGILRDTVRERGFQALVACDGEAGLALAARFLPDAIILDVMLPHIDGWGVMRTIKDNPGTRHIPVHFITCLEERQKALNMGAIGFATKPVSADELGAVLASIGAAIDKTVRKLLVVEDDEAEAKSVAALLENGALEITLARSGREALALLDGANFDCMVLDLGLSDMSGFELLDQLQARADAPHMPVIVHSGRSLSSADEARLRRYADSIIVKGAKSPERLLGEVSLFLHLVESALPQEKQTMIRRALDKEAMFEQRTVLLVDDDIRNIFSLSSVLGEKGMHIVEASNGVEALAMLEAHPEIDIVLMDIMMPEMDGFEAIRRIRLDPRHRKLPVIGLTAKAMLGDQKQCLDAGASDYLSKPVDLDKLFSLMRVWLYQAEAGR